MMFIEREDGMDYTNEEDSHIKHDMDRKTMAYVCEDCDYRWIAQMNVELNENYNGETARFRDQELVTVKSQGKTYLYNYWEEQAYALMQPQCDSEVVWARPLTRPSSIDKVKRTDL